MREVPLQPYGGPRGGRGSSQVKYPCSHRVLEQRVSLLLRFGRVSAEPMTDYGSAYRRRLQLSRLAFSVAPAFKTGRPVTTRLSACFELRQQV